MVENVASPTPIVPTFADSTRVTEIRSENAARRYVAVIHPAVPPPTTTTLLSTCSPQDTCPPAQNRVARRVVLSALRGYGLPGHPEQEIQTYVIHITWGIRPVWNH